MSGYISQQSEENTAASEKRNSERDARKTYYSLGIVLDRDLNNGSFWPSYVLCFAQTTSDKRSGYRVVKQFDGKPKFNLPKVLVTSIYGHEDMLDYLSDYRTQDKMHGVHYYPSGALCWFECNHYGDPTGSVYYARKIPDMKLLEIPRRRRGFAALLNKQKKAISLKEKLIKEKSDVEKIVAVKPRFHQ